MNKLNILSLVTIVMLIILNTNRVVAEDGITKVIAEKTFTINTNANLLVDHEHGNVYCNNWDKNEISVTLIAHTKTNNEEKAEEAFKKVIWEIKGNSDEIVARCKISGKGGGDSNIWIDMKIYMPKSINLNLSHKFGKAFVEEVDGTALINSEYGTISVNSLTNSKSKFKIAYGEGHVNEFDGNSIVVQYSKFGFGKAADASIRSDYSDIQGDEITNSSVKLEGGNLNLGRAVSIKGISSFSSFNISHLIRSIDIETTYGSLNIDNVDPNFSEINVENNFGSVNLKIDPDASYLFEAEAKQGSIVYPENKAKINFREKTVQHIILKGSIGSNNNPNAKVTLQSNYGSVNIIN
jgi:hypothetical protein